MPKRYPSDSDFARSQLLQASLNQTQQQVTAGKTSYLNDAQLAELNTFVEAFTTAVDNTNKALGTRVREVEEKDAVIGKLISYIRDFWEVLIRRTYREEHSVEVLRLYGLTTEGARPNPSREADWLTWAKTILEGELQAVEAGYPPMQNPDTTGLSTLLSQAQKEVADVTIADTAYQEAQQTLANLRPQAQAWEDEIVAQVLHGTRQLEPSAQRRVARRYGVRYAYLPDEPVDDGDTDGVVLGENGR